ncbi:hypothetical protein SEA_RICKMORE_87 [Gordonia phage Rickmore]|uniref:Uncharacterized protein n=1 Tax=Gordonia phage Rickmore TaxID=2507854 RepID=A0A410TBI9_9CAUD|nr:hypothetical protein HWC05_gp87 [Gordonia phage Rickmore]QAU06327.1 hypothetical protein SEA_RICKMORE_87 [Gordonia phage Rickmore]
MESFGVGGKCGQIWSNPAKSETVMKSLPKCYQNVTKFGARFGLDLSDSFGGDVSDFDQNLVNTCKKVTFLVKNVKSYAKNFS